MPRLRRICRDLAADRDALTRRQRRCQLDVEDQQIKGLLSMRLDELQLRESGLEGFDVITVLQRRYSGGRFLESSPPSAAATLRA